MTLSYELPLFRPPSEAESLILQVTLGCSHNRCTFCSMYRTKDFRPQPRARIEQLVLEAKALRGDDVRRVFLADGDAMCLSTRRLLEVLDLLHTHYPALSRVAIYANARDVLRKTDQELQQLRARKLRLLYLGLESGDDETLARVDKGASAEEIEEAVQRAQAAGMSTSVMVLLGLAGRQRSRIHAQTSARSINRMAPTYTALLTYTPTPLSPLAHEVAQGTFELLSPTESLEEIRDFLLNMSCRTYFTCNHASNYLPLKGKMPSAKAGLLSLVEAALAGQLPLKPEALRGL